MKYKDRFLVTDHTYDLMLPEPDLTGRAVYSRIDPENPDNFTYVFRDPAHMQEVEDDDSSSS